MRKEKIASPSLREAKVLALEHVANHRFLPDYVKPLAKELVIKHFQSLGAAIGSLELAARRAEAPKSK